MTWVAVGVGVVGAGTAVYSGNQAANASADASKAAQEGNLLAMLEAQRQEKKADAKALPYEKSGVNALNQLNWLMGLGNPDYVQKTAANFNDEGYIKNRKAVYDKSVMDKWGKKKPAKAAALIAQADKARAAMFAEPGSAYQQYQKQIKNKTVTDSNAFWKKPDGSAMGGEGQPDSYGQLQQRFNNALFEKDPGYQFRMDEGARAVDSSAAARGGLLSGAALKGMERYGQGFAANEYDNAYNRFTNDQGNRYNRLASMAGQGQVQVGQSAARGSQFAGDMARGFTGIGEAKGAGAVGASNARQSGYSQIGNTLMDLGSIYAANKKPNYTQFDNSYSNQPMSTGSRSTF